MQLSLNTSFIVLGGLLFLLLAGSLCQDQVREQLNVQLCWQIWGGSWIRSNTSDHALNKHLSKALVKQMWRKNVPNKSWSENIIYEKLHVSNFLLRDAITNLRDSNFLQSYVKCLVDTSGNQDILLMDKSMQASIFCSVRTLPAPQDWTAYTSLNRVHSNQFCILLLLRIENFWFLTAFLHVF